MRRRVIEEKPNYRMIACSVTDAGWLDEIALDESVGSKPTLVVAEGLLMYLTEDETRGLLQRITDRFPSGEVVFDAMPPSVTWMQRLFKSSIRNRRQIERWNPRLRCVEDTSPWRLYPLVASRVFRGVYAAMSRLPWFRSF